MSYQPWKPWNPYGLKEKDQAALGCLGTAALGLIVIFSGIHFLIKNKHKNEPVAITKSALTTEQREVWHLQDKRGLFHWNTDFIIAKDASDSLYADMEKLDLGEFLPNGQVIVREHKRKYAGWSDDTDLMNYEMK